MILPFLPLIVCVVGLIVYAFATNAKVEQIGKTMFFCGLLAYLLGTK